jgi:hypothetical protein
LFSKAVKNYFDREAVKTRLKPVKTGFNWSKPGRSLTRLGNTINMSRVVKKPLLFDARIYEGL